VCATKANKGRKHIVCQPDDWVWVHMHKERFSAHFISLRGSMTMLINNSQSDRWIELPFYMESPDMLSYIGLQCQVNRSL
jgi:hypothetical protein